MSTQNFEPLVSSRESSSFYRSRRTYSSNQPAKNTVEEQRPFASLHLFRGDDPLFSKQTLENLSKFHYSHKNQAGTEGSTNFIPYSTIGNTMKQSTVSRSWTKTSSEELIKRDYRRQRPLLHSLIFEDRRENFPPERKLSSILATDFPSVQREIHRRHSYPPEEHTEETIQTDLNRSYPRGHGQQPKVVFVDELEKRMEDKENLILHKENLKSTDKETCLRTRAEKMVTSNKMAGQNARSSPSTVIKEYNLKTVLQNESSQVVPAVEKFVQSNLDGSTTNSVNENDELEVKLMGLKHIETPLKHYWDKVFRVGNGSKSATIRIESLLNMEINDNKITGFSNANYVPQHRPSSVSTQQLLFKTNGSSGKASQQLSSAISRSDSKNQESLISATTSSPYYPTSSHYSISPTSDYDSSSSSSQTDLLSVVHRKIHQKIKLDWSDLFLLKNAHCRFVLPREKLLKSVKDNAVDTAYAKELEIEIIKNYKHYQLVLEECVVIDKLYTQLAFYIMKAEAYWYAARTTSDICLRNHSYNVASRRYIELLTLAKEHLSPDDRSLLTILEKVSTVLVECTVYGTLGNFRTQQDSTTFVQNCRQAVVEAEKTLATKMDVKKERKLIKIKNNLMRLSSSTMSQKIY